jgi:hypothetical protein
MSVSRRMPAGSAAGAVKGSHEGLLPIPVREPYIWGMVTSLNLLRYCVFASALLLSACGDDCSSYSKFSCDQIQKADYNVLFYLGDREEHLGQARGLAQCGNVARARASKLEPRPSDWSYVCCMIAKGSPCYEKHR